jgi:VWFA-related protein
LDQKRIMKRSFVVLLFGVAPLALLGQEKPQPSPSPAAVEAPTFPSQVELVTVDAVVTDKKGSAVSGLTKDDFTILEDGQPQSIASFEAVNIPSAPSATPVPRPRVSTNILPPGAAHTGRSFTIVFDSLHLTPFQARRAKIAVAEFLKSGTREGDRVMLVGTGGEAWWSARMESGRDELTALLKRLDGRLIPDTGQDRVTDYEAMRIQVYDDQQVAQRVQRRFETYGVNPQGRAGSANNSGNVGPGANTTDPMVRGKATEIYFQAVARNRLTLEAMERALNALVGARGRKSLILVSEGFIYDPNMDEFKRVLEASRRSDVAIYFLDTRGLSGLPVEFTAEFGPAIDEQDIGAAFAESWEASEGAQGLSIDSGGFSVTNTNDLNKGIERIADEAKVYYLLGYNPTNTKHDGRFRKIQVKIARKGVDVRARKGYYATLEGGKSALTKKQPTNIDSAFQEALDSPFDADSIPLRMTAFTLDETMLGKAHVLVATDVDVRGFAFEQKEGRSTDTVEFLLVVSHRDSGEYFRYDQKVEMKLLPETRERLGKTWFNIMRDFELAPGGYQAKIVIRDKANGKIGTVTHNFEVPDLSQFRTSSPLISDVLQPAPEGSKAPPRPALVVRRNFPSGAKLFCQFEVFGAAPEKGSGMPKVTAGYTIQRADGGVQMRVEPTPIRPTSLGKLSRLVGTTLGGFAQGDYELVLNLKDEVSGKTLEVREPFSVEAPSGS